MRRTTEIILGVIVIALIPSFWLPGYTNVNLKSPATKSLDNEHQLHLCCIEYASDHNGQFPSSFTQLSPEYMYINPGDLNSVSRSPINPADPNGYTLTPGLTVTSPSNTILIEDNFAPTKLKRRLSIDVQGTTHTIDLRTKLERLFNRRSF